MRRLFLFMSCFIAAFCLGGLPLIDRATQKPINNYQINADGTVSPHQQTGNLLIYAGAEKKIKYTVADLNRIEQEKRNVAIKP
jgi:hypothetical protein